MKALILALLLVIALAGTGHAYFSINVEMNSLRPVLGSSSNFLNINSNFNPSFSVRQNLANIQYRGPALQFNNNNNMQLGAGLNLPVPTFSQGSLPGVAMNLNFQRNFGSGLDMHVNMPNFQLPTTNYPNSEIRINNCVGPCVPCS